MTNWKVGQEVYVTYGTRKVEGCAQNILKVGRVWITTTPKHSPNRFVKDSLRGEYDMQLWESEAAYRQWVTRADRWRLIQRAASSYTMPRHLTDADVDVLCRVLRVGT